MFSSENNWLAQYRTMMMKDNTDDDQLVSITQDESCHKVSIIN